MVEITDHPMPTTTEVDMGMEAVAITEDTVMKRLTRKIMATAVSWRL